MSSIAFLCVRMMIPLIAMLLLAYPILAPAMTDGIISGTVFNGPVMAARVTAFAVHGGAVTAQIASVATDGQGRFTVPLGGYSGPVVLQASGVTYIDEATRMTMTMAVSEYMTAVVPAVASGETVAGIWVTPVTAMAQARAAAMGGGITDFNIAIANSAIGNYFSISDILRVQPLNPLLPGSGAGAGQDVRNYGMVLAAISKYANLNMANTSSLIVAMMNDAADGIMDGRNGANPTSMPITGMTGIGQLAFNAGTTGLVAAMTAFLSSDANVSGLTAADMAVLMQRLNISSGSI